MLNKELLLSTLHEVEFIRFTYKNIPKNAGAIHAFLEKDIADLWIQIPCLSASIGVAFGSCEILPPPDGWGKEFIVSVKAYAYGVTDLDWILKGRFRLTCTIKGTDIGIKSITSLNSATIVESTEATTWYYTHDPNKGPLLLDISF